MLRADYHDGCTALVYAVQLWIVGEELLIRGSGIERRLPFSSMCVSEKLGRAPRRLTLPDGAFCEVRDFDALAALLAQARHREGLVDRAQRHLPTVLLSLVATAGLLLAAWRWGLPWATEEGADHMPAAIGHLLGTQTLRVLDGQWLKPSAFDPGRRQRIADAFAALRTVEGPPPESEVLFRSSPAIGPNAFTLPDGNIIMLDQLLAIVSTNEPVGNQEALAVLAHELGHARHRHPMRRLLESSTVAAFWSFYVGDISGLLAAAPTAVMQARYSRQLEREADDYAVQTLLLNGISPARLADALEKLKASHPGSGGSSYLATHPAPDERIKRLREAAANSI